jgi:SAM-dependent methyltransferase
MLDYDREADAYDATRGGVPRAEAAAAAVLGLVPDRARTLLDIGCGTGLVTERLRRPGLRVLGCDGSYGMARKAAGRIGGFVVLGPGRHHPRAVEGRRAGPPERGAAAPGLCRRALPHAVR